MIHEIHGNHASVFAHLEKKIEHDTSTEKKI